jgi:hypothetical protein
LVDDIDATDRYDRSESKLPSTARTMRKYANRKHNCIERKHLEQEKDEKHRAVRVLVVKRGMSKLVRGSPFAANRIEEQGESAW